MNSTRTTTVAAIAAGVILIVGLIAFVGWKLTRAALPETQETKITQTVEKIQEANVGLPDPQVQAKTLIFTAMIQKQIPPAARWCDTLNVGGKLWPVTPTNTAFALDARVAGRPFSRANMPPGDVVVFFETSKPGWNQAGGSELLASKPEGVAVALADGRSMIVSPAEVAGLRWTP
jgi:hypothetical protein